MYQQNRLITAAINIAANICPNCGSKNILNNEFSPEEKPYVIRTEHTCYKCRYYWYEED